MAAVKGVRTRYRNTIEKELDKARTVLKSEVSDISTGIVNVKSCKVMLKTYSEKLMVQTEKVAEVFEEKEPEFVERMLDEDCELNVEVESALFELDQFGEYLESQQFEKDKRQTSDTDRLVELQEQMQQVMLSQVEQQRELMDHLERREKKSHASIVKLPTLDLHSFSGDKLQWCEFWDAFECSVHKNLNLSNIEKFNYLHSKLGGEAQRAVSGLSRTNENYDIAVQTLMERYGNKQEMIDIHYRELLDIKSPTTKVESMRVFVDNVERNLCCLEKLGESVNQRIFVSMVRAKLPEEVHRQLEFNKGVHDEWTVDTLRQHLRDYISICEKACSNDLIPKNAPNHKSEMQMKGKVNYANRQHDGANSARRSSAESLLVNNGVANKQRSRIECKYCNKNHWSDQCSEYQTLFDRKRKIRGSCFRCLKWGHKATECKSNKSCVYCGVYNMHHRSLCPKQFGPRKPTEQVHLSDVTSGENVMISAGETVLMQIATLEVKNPKGHQVMNTRLLLDCGSQRTYVSQNLADKLGLKAERVEELKVITFGSSESKVVKTCVATLDLKLKNGDYLQMTVNIVPIVSGDLQRRCVDIKSIKNFDNLINNVELADTIPRQNESTSIDLLIGSDYYLDLILSQKIEVNPGLYLLNSKLGWVLTGRTKSDTDSECLPSMLSITYGRNFTKSQVFQNIDSVLAVKPDLEDFWKMESIGITDESKGSEDELAMENFKQTVQFKEGRYFVTWPWKEEDPDLHENKELAFGRLKSSMRKLKNTPEMLQKYDGVIKDQLSKGIIEKVENNNSSTLRHYIPHHAVITPNKSTTKLRVVYDASASTRDNKSLNECLYRGPVMLHDLCGLLMRFRLHKVALVSDIEKAFLQVALQPNERDVTRFLWVKDIKNPSLDRQNIQEFRFTRSPRQRRPFGIISSPFLLGATIESHLDSYKTEVTEKLKSDIYVDNVITGSISEGEAIALYTSAKTIFKEASMNLREWLSNSEIVNDIIPMCDRSDRKDISVLGYSWNAKSDTLALKRPKGVPIDSVYTKRYILQRVASVFDPLGLFAPVTLEGKALLQSIWSKGYEWDDIIEDSEVVNRWIAVQKEIEAITSHRIPRVVVMDDVKETRLLCFCDSSKVAYAAAVYLHQKNEHDSVCNLLFAKTRLAPVKELTIPKLELMAVVIGVRCLEYVKQQIKIPTKEEYLWTDSKVVIGWINSVKSLPVFVNNRVKEIKKNKELIIKYINTKENPADVATKGSKGTELIENKLWWHGPESLMEKNGEEVTGENMVNHIESCSIDTCTSETDCYKVYSDPVIPDDSQPPFGIDIEGYSSLTKLLRVTAYMYRFIEKLRKTKCDSITLTSKDIKRAELVWLQFIQKKHYSKEVDSISTGKQTCLQRQLGLYIDSDNLVRCCGRLDNAGLAEGARRPLLLPPKDTYTRLVVEQSHKEIFHSGISQTLSRIRQRFWVPKGRATVKSVLRQCVTCRRYEGGPYKMPPFAPLPAVRVQESQAFSNTGVDYLGPLVIKAPDGVKKVWICLFTCMVVRAIHLEVVQDMTSDEFILCLKRFISVRGTPLTVISDNTPQFKLSNKLLTHIWDNIKTDEEIQSYVAKKGIQWKFIVELAPWIGGFYERLVGVVKRSLRKSLGRKLLTLVQLQTLVKEIEAVVNTRPLVYVGDDINSDISLTPNHFLTLNYRTGIPETQTDEDPDFIPQESSVDKLLQVWKKGQRLLDSFWKIWREDYLTSLRERFQNELKAGRVQSSISPSIGDVVVVKDNVPRGSWKTAKIVKLIKSRDGHVRSAKIQFHTGRVLGRPLNLLYPVECTGNSIPDTESSPSPLSGSPSNALDRPTRKAAIIARRKLKCI